MRASMNRTTASGAIDMVIPLSCKKWLTNLRNTLPGKGNASSYRWHLKARIFNKKFGGSCKPTLKAKPGVIKKLPTELAIPRLAGL